MAADVAADVPEITTECWEISGGSRSAPVCDLADGDQAQKGAAGAAAVAFTLLSYDSQFELGNRLVEVLISQSSTLHKVLRAWAPEAASPAQLADE